MSMSDRTEGEMTALVDRVAEQVVGDRWANLLRYPDQHMVKEQLLPIVTATVEAVDAESHKAKRGDEIEAWIKRERDRIHRGAMPEAWDMLDMLLEDYRLHADTGTPLSSDVDEMGG